MTIELSHRDTTLLTDLLEIEADFIAAYTQKPDNERLQHCQQLKEYIINADIAAALAKQAENGTD